MANPESPWSVVAFGQLSQRVNDTHGLMIGLAKEFQDYRRHNDELLTKVVEGITAISSKQQAEDQAVERLVEEKGQKIARRANWLNRILIAVTGLSTVVAGLALLH